uniref:Uncharacterized protein n=1 Tax=Arundo donax TaxID=35708 RepID=A0A0A9DB79_ARUDO
MFEKKNNYTSWFCYASEKKRRPKVAAVCHCMMYTLHTFWYFVDESWNSFSSHNLNYSNGSKS